MQKITVDLDNESIFIGENQVDKPQGINDEITLTGRVSGKLFDAEGNLKQEIEISNLVTTVGKNWLAKKLAQESANEMTHMAVGTSATAPAVGNTTLAGSELGRVAFASKTRTGNAVAIVATFPAGTATGTLNEAGIFDGSSGTEMLARVTFGGAVTKGALDSFQVTWTITMS
jgi:hypothetical protein